MTMMMKGTVKQIFNRGDNRFGFIKDDAGVEFFFLPSSMQKMEPIGFDALKVGDTVEFISQAHPRGKRAVGVRKLAEGD